jgi:hypothetical protein
VKTAFPRKRFQCPAGSPQKRPAFLAAFFVLWAIANNGFADDSESFSFAKDFAGTIEITGNSGSLLSFEIPEAVYRGLERSDMADMRIYDSRGNPAPFLVRGPKGTVTVPAEKNVPILAWNEKAGQFTSSSPDLEINVSGTAITINPSAGTKPRADSSGGARGLYLVDLSGFPENPAPSKLVLDFEGNEFFNARVSIRKSDDLSRWEDYGKTQTAAFYDNPGTDRNEFDIPRTRYLLLEFSGKIPPVNSARVRFDPMEIAAAPRETFFSGTKSADGKTVRYHTEGRFPVKKIRFDLSRPDSIRVVVKSRNSGEDDWVFMGETTVYRIETPGEAPSMNEPVDVRGGGPYWEIEIPGEQVFTEVPRMALLWEAREIVFLARGDGPWILAYGGAAYGPPESSLSVQDKAEIFPAALGRACYTKPETDGEAGTGRWEQAALWGVLVLAAAILSVLAVTIIKTTKNGG